VITKTFSPSPDHVRVIFELPALLRANQVALVGDFNGWDPAATPFCQDRDGVWRAVVDLPMGEQHEFRYLIDGRWSTDYHADGAALNPYGSFNSVVWAEPPARQPDRCLECDMVHERPLPPPGQSATRAGSPAGARSGGRWHPAGGAAAEPRIDANQANRDRKRKVNHAPGTVVAPFVPGFAGMAAVL
jgi:hypothetical protein